MTDAELAQMMDERDGELIADSDSPLSVGYNPPCNHPDQLMRYTGWTWMCACGVERAHHNGGLMPHFWDRPWYGGAQ